ncbi:exodeoxyribonuclease VII small subunit [Fontisphaera persica]|uniref:exodeoxyribonuclease VII small subunit n=1 Tax=Fontisphaera persica TaxID=2974023 RepID=UPI0024C00DFC|nr:exodeoxyribonuclease VII small subunit [Fontisphaera persica]WCJ60780.1 exodeoxyribonuclease VII small subunit [Fontisphaera persica]
MSKAANHRAAADAASPQVAQDLAFEEAMDRLEKVVQRLEGEELPLEALLRHYTEGVELARICQQKLTEAELKIRQLEQTLAGTPALNPVNVPEEAP